MTDTDLTERLAALYVAGSTLHQAAAMCGVSFQRARKAALVSGVMRPHGHKLADRQGRRTFDCEAYEAARRGVML